MTPLPSIFKYTRPDQLVDFFLVCILLIQRVVIAFLINPKSIMRPKRIVIVEGLLATFMVSQARTRAIHHDTQFGP